MIQEWMIIHEWMMIHVWIRIHEWRMIYEWKVMILLFFLFYLWMNGDDSFIFFILFLFMVIHFLMMIYSWFINDSIFTDDNDSFMTMMLKMLQWLWSWGKFLQCWNIQFFKLICLQYFGFIRSLFWQFNDQKFSDC